MLKIGWYCASFLLPSLCCLDVYKRQILYNTNRKNNLYCQCKAIGKCKEALEYGVSRKDVYKRQGQQPKVRIATV